MKICFWHSDKARERILSEAFAEGAKRCGDEVERRRLEPEVEVADCDVAVMVGVKSRERWQAHWRAGINVVMLDKGYCRGKGESPVRGWEYWRVAVNDHHPTKYIGLGDMKRPSDRLLKLDLDMSPNFHQNVGGHVLIAGSSAKYHDFYGLKDPTSYAYKLVKRIRDAGFDGRIVYRPKPSWKDAKPIPGTEFSGGSVRNIQDALFGAHAMVTHGSNASFEAMLMGIPAIVLGQAVSRPISSTDIADICNPRMPTVYERYQLLCNLSYCQWTLKEFASGEAWRETRGLIYE